jgi:hypothetical protein
MADNVTYQSSTLATPASGTKVSADEDVTNGIMLVPTLMDYKYKAVPLMMQYPQVIQYRLVDWQRPMMAQTQEALRKVMQ